MKTWNLNVNFYYDDRHMVQLPVTLPENDGRTLHTVLLDAELAQVIHKKAETMLNREL